MMKLLMKLLDLEVPFLLEEIYISFEMIIRKQK